MSRGPERLRVTRLEPNPGREQGDDPRDLIPVEVSSCCTGDMVDVLRHLDWSNIVWSKAANRVWRRREDGFVSSDFVVVDVDEMGDRTEAQLVTQCEAICDRFLVMTSRSPGRYRVVLWTDRTMTDLSEHSLVHSWACTRLSGDRACLDGSDWYRACLKASNPDSGRVVRFAMSGSRMSVDWAIESSLVAVLLAGLQYPTSSPLLQYSSNTGAPIIQGLDTALDEDTTDLEAYARRSGRFIAPDGTGERNATAFRVFRNIGAKADSLGRFHETMHLMRLANAVAPDPKPECDLQSALRSITRYRDQGRLWRARPVAPKAYVKRPTMPCECGCGTAVDQKIGKGRPAKWAPGHKPRKSRAKARILTAETTTHEGTEATAVGVLDREDAGETDQRTDEGSRGGGGPCDHGIGGTGRGEAAADPDEVREDAVLHRPGRAIDDAGSGAGRVIEAGGGLRSLGEAEVPRASRVDGPEARGPKMRGAAPVRDRGADRGPQVPAEMRLRLRPGAAHRSAGQEAIIRSGPSLPPPRPTVDESIRRLQSLSRRVA